MTSRAWALALVLTGCTCDPAALNGTALRIRVNISEEVLVTQLRFAARVDGGNLFDPTVRPELEGDRLMSGGSLLALLPDSLDGQRVACDVEGLQMGMIVAAASQEATVKKGIEVSCTAQLLPPQSCDSTNCTGCCVGNICLGGGDQGACGSGGSPCALCNPGQRCGQGACLCDAASCGGCCSGVTCLDGGSTQACGKSGAMCSSCLAGQDCTGGMCTCDGGPCGVGCTAQSCTGGCCSAGTCLMLGAATCAPPGSGTTCIDCRTAQADSCTMMGACSCGNRGTPCPSTLHCVAGQCICDNSVCSGCCQNDTCYAGDVKQRCGIDGGTCANCTGGAMCGANRICQ